MRYPHFWQSARAVVGLLCLGMILPLWTRVQATQSSRSVPAAGDASLDRLPSRSDIVRGVDSERKAEPLTDTGNRRLRVLNGMRQKSLVADTQKLLRLSSELKAEIDRSAAASLTPEELHKLSEIEKLARSVKAKMSDSLFIASPAWTGMGTLSQ